MVHNQSRLKSLLFFVSLLFLICSCNALQHRRRVHRAHKNTEVKLENVRSDLLSQCTLYWRNATLNHFSFVNSKGVEKTFKQRYYVCDKFWTPATSTSGPGPIFFYTGNEADVLLYLNNTGLMWETAPSFGAMLVFAEHRYYGKSRPFAPWPKTGPKPYQLDFLSTEQAMFDYVEIIDEVKKQFKAEQSAVIAFGGSYGGMLAAWMRMKYPHAVDGAVAASAPIWNFFGESPAFDTGSFAQGVTYDASEEAGSSKGCIANVRAFWPLLASLAKTPDGLALINQEMDICPAAAVTGPASADALRDWLADAWDNMAMGNFPYASGYILNGDGVLPPFPIHEACRQLSAAAPSAAELLRGMALAAGIYYNHSGSLTCFDYTAGVNDATSAVELLWDFQWCSELFMPSSTDGVNDMFWAEPFDEAAAAADCRASWQVSPRVLHAQREWGGRRIEAASNIVFTNGLLDPWHGGGVITVPPGASGVVALVIPEGAHHLDLMFSNPGDPISVLEVRKTQRKLMRQWIATAAERYSNVTRRDAVAADAGGEKRGEGLGSGSGSKVEAVIAAEEGHSADMKNVGQELYQKGKGEEKAREKRSDHDNDRDGEKETEGSQTVASVISVGHASGLGLDPELGSEINGKKGSTVVSRRLLFIAQ